MTSIEAVPDDPGLARDQSLRGSRPMARLRMARQSGCAGERSVRLRTPALRVASVVQSR